MSWQVSSQESLAFFTELITHTTKSQRPITRRMCDAGSTKIDNAR